MRKLLFLLLILSNKCTICHAQDSTLLNYDMMADNIVVGTRIFKHTFYSQFGDIQHYNLNSAPKTIGYTWSGTGRFTKKFVLADYYSLSIILPYKIQLNDSISGKLNGTIFSFSPYGLDLFPNSKVIHFTVSPGINLGRLRISGDKLIHQKNPFISPTISIQPQIRIKNLLFTIRADYEVDVSNDQWKSLLINKKQDKISLPPLNQTACSFYLSVGWMFKRLDGVKRQSLYN